MPKVAGSKKDRIKSRENFKKNVISVLENYKAELVLADDLCPRYEVATPVGILSITIYADPDQNVWIAQKFDDVERATFYAQHLGKQLNINSGKWNFIFGDNSPKAISEVAFIGWWKTIFEWLMQQPVAPTPANRYEVVVAKIGKVLVNRKDSLNAAERFRDGVIEMAKENKSIELPIDPTEYLVQKSPDPTARSASGELYKFL